MQEALGGPQAVRNKKKEKEKWGLNKKTWFLLRALRSRHIF
jgi:hypothetical protein